MSEEKYDPKTFKMYMKVAIDSQASSPIASYFLANFTLNKAVEYLKAQRAKGSEDQDLTKEVQGWFQILEDMKRVVGPELQDREECKKKYYEYAYSYFLRADNKYRDDDYSTQLAQEFFYATVLLDAYTIFGPSEETATHKKYAKVARLKIMKAIKTGNLPVPKTKKEEKPASESDIPDDAQGGIKAFGNFKPNESIINKAPANNIPSNQGYNTGYNNPYGQAPSSTPYGGYGTDNSFPQGSYGQQEKPGALPDFNKFGATQTAGTGATGGSYPAVGNFGNPTPGYGMEPSPNQGYGGATQQGGGQTNKPKVIQPRRGQDFYQKTEKAKELCKKAMAELEYKRVKQFKDNLEAALQLLESLEGQ